MKGPLLDAIRVELRALGSGRPIVPPEVTKAELLAYALERDERKEASA